MIMIAASFRPVSQLENLELTRSRWSPTLSGSANFGTVVFPQSITITVIKVATDMTLISLACFHPSSIESFPFPLPSPSPTCTSSQ